MNTEILKEMGFTKNEISVYIALLQIGATTAGPLTKKSRIHRSRVYEALERLIAMGLVSYNVQANKKYFRAQNPQVLIDIADEKKRQIMELVPILSALQETEEERQETTVYEGYKGLRTVFDNAINQLNKGDEILVFGARSGQDISSETWTAFFSNFNKKRIEKRIKYKIIFNTDLKNAKIIKEFSKSKLTQVRFISQKTLAGINIHGDNVAIIVWKKKPYVFLITSKEVSESFKEYFKILWEHATS